MNRFHVARRRPARGALALLSVLVLAACGGGDDSVYPGSAQYKATIQRTTWGIPHITAPDEAGLGYGVGYSYAQDNFCVLADEVLTVNGERSKWLGADAANIYGRNNLRSDFYFKLVNDETQAKAFLVQQSATSLALIRGYVAGINRYFNETGAANLPGDCKGQPWLRAITELDMARLVRRLSVEASGMQFIDAIYAAQPPAVAVSAVRPFQQDLKRQARTLMAATDGPFSKQHWDDLHQQTGSNAVALGAEATANGVGHLLGNPHFPWFGALRFYQLHVTIPGKLDVMGGALTGFPGVNIGFNQNLAWSHTVNTSAHFTLFALQLDPADPTRYLYDGVSRPLEKKTVTVEVKGATGLTTQTRTVYSSHHGPIVVRAGQLDWTRASAFAFKDANLDNGRLIEQWNTMNQASSLAELKGALESVVGIPWVNTVAVDRGGNALYANISVVPNVSSAKEAACIAPPFKPFIAAAGLYILGGNTAACEWDVDASTRQPGIIAGKNLPAIERRDYVQNSNDSAWLANPAAPITSFPSIVSRSNLEQNGRTRIGLTQIGARLAGTDGLPGSKFNLANLQTIALNNRVYYADIALDGLLALACAGASTQTVGTQVVDLAAPCATLAAWDKRAELTSVGFPLFAAWWDKLGASRNAMWAVPFSAADPVNTPRGIRTGDAALTGAVRTALANAVLQLVTDKIDYTKPWGQLQVAIKANPISVHGGDGTYGIYNAIRSSIVPQAPGVRVVNFGTSYIQTVTWDGSTPRVEAFLTYSNSTNPGSPNYGNQTLAFMAKQWIALPYTQEQIRKDPFLSTSVIYQ